MELALWIATHSLETFLCVTLLIAAYAYWCERTYDEDAILLEHKDKW